MKSILSGLRNAFFLCCMVLGLTAILQAQTVRKNDVIITRDNEKIEVVVQEVDASTVKYKKVSDPDGPVFTLNKTEISSILYGNGEVEKFDSKPQIYYNETETPAPVISYKKINPNARLSIETIHDWNADQLRANYKFYLRKAENYRKLGTAGLIGGIILTGTGIGIMASSNNGNYYNDFGKFLGGYMMFLSGVGAGIPLTIVGFVKKKSYTRKALLVKDELRRRKEPFVLNFNPAFNPATQSAGLAVKVSF